MPSGRTFRPGPRAEYKQRPLRAANGSLGTTPIESPLDVAYTPGGAKWRSGRAAMYRRWPHAAMIRQQLDTEMVPPSVDIASPLDVAYAIGGTRWRQTILGVQSRRSWPHHEVAKFLLDQDFPPAEITGAVAWTQDDDVWSATGDFTDQELIGDGGIRWRAQAPARLRRGSEAYYQRRPLPVPPETYTASVAWTQDDDLWASIGQADEPYSGDSPARTRAQSSVYRRLASRLAFTRRIFNLPQDTTVVASAAWTQDDDVWASAGTFDDPAYGDGGARARAQSSVYRRLASRLPFRRRRLTAPIEDVNATAAWGQDADTWAVAATFTEPEIPGIGVRLQVIHAARRPRRALYCQRPALVDVGTATPELPPLIPPFAAYLTAYQATSVGTTARSSTVGSVPVTSTVGTTAKATTVNTTPEGVSA